MKERNQGQIKDVGDIGVLGIQVTVSRSMDIEVKKREKEKGVMVDAGLKFGSSALRPNNDIFGVKANVRHGVFDDGSQSGPMGAIKNIVIQPVDVSLTLNKEKHTAMRIMDRKNMDLYNDKENVMFKFGKKTGASQELQSRAHNIIYRQKGKPLDEIMGSHLHASVELKSAMEGLVCDHERTSEKTLMEECIVVEDAWNDEVV
ncbi:hypothetical protein PVK06_012991 [Gossypium arboreum]|uniref:Uncharacterized protein n=1 Tax=Gossypium arboreum TaxID=29729 RepID=A0ABR0QDA3_GOSAR|nr:hypothetical protein PVK06_012991 [Gossypium arboreum]